MLSLPSSSKVDTLKASALQDKQDNYHTVIDEYAIQAIRKNSFLLLSLVRKDEREREGRREIFRGFGEHGDASSRQIRPSYVKHICASNMSVDLVSQGNRNKGRGQLVNTQTRTHRI